MRKVVLILSMLCFVSCHHSRTDNDCITAHMEIFEEKKDYGEKYREFYRFLKISLTNHSEATDYYLPSFDDNLVMYNSNYNQEDSEHSLADGVMFASAISSVEFGSYGRDMSERSQYMCIPGYDSLRMLAIRTYENSIKIIPRDSHKLVTFKVDSLSRKSGYSYCGSCVFIKAGETVSMLVNIACLYVPGVETRITYNDSIPRDRTGYRKYLYRINDDDHSEYETYPLSDSLKIPWDGIIAYPAFSPSIVAGRYHLYEKQIKCADTIIISR